MYSASADARGQTMADRSRRLLVTISGFPTRCLKSRLLTDQLPPLCLAPTRSCGVSASRLRRLILRPVQQGHTRTLHLSRRCSPSIVSRAWSGRATRVRLEFLGHGLAIAGDSEVLGVLQTHSGRGSIPRASPSRPSGALLCQATRSRCRRIADTGHGSVGPPCRTVKVAFTSRSRTRHGTLHTRDSNVVDQHRRALD